MPTAIRDSCRSMTGENLTPAGTRVTTGDTGVLAICDCRDQSYRDDLYTVTPETERNVVIRRDGTVTNRFADGTVGVTEEVAKMAEADEEPFCPECGDYIRGWLHTGNRPENNIEADRGDMVAYMREAAELGTWRRPSIADRDVPETVAMAIDSECETYPVYTLVLDSAVIGVHRIADTHHVLQRRSEPDRDDMWRLPYWGEACLDVRYWLLQAELNDFDVTVDSITDDVVDCIIESSPPEWTDDILTLLDKYHRDGYDRTPTTTDK